MASDLAELPDGSLAEIPRSMAAEHIPAHLKEHFPHLFPDQPPSPPGAGLMSSLGSATNSIKEKLAPFVPDKKLPSSNYLTAGVLSNFVPDKMKAFMRDYPEIISGKKPNIGENITRDIGEYAPLGAAMEGPGAS